MPSLVGCWPNGTVVAQAAVTQAELYPTRNFSFCAACTLGTHAGPMCPTLSYIDTIAMKKKRLIRAEYFVQEPGHEFPIVNLLLLLHSAAVRRQPRQRAIFLDIGMNAGFFTNLMAAQGAEVHSFETQPKCVGYSSAALRATGPWATSPTAPSPDGHTNAVRVYNAGLSDTPGTIRQSTGGCDGFNKALSPESTSLQMINAFGGGMRHVPTFVLDDTISPDCDPRTAIFAAKMDTEGAEIIILRGMRRLLAAHRVTNLLIEITPLNWQSYGVVREKGVAVLAELSAVGFEAYHLWDNPDPTRPVAGTDEPPQLERKAPPTGASTALGGANAPWHPLRGARCSGSSSVFRRIVDWRAYVDGRVEARGGANIWFRLPAAATAPTSQLP